MRKRYKLSAKLALLIGLLTVIPLLLISLALYNERKENIKAMVAENLGAMTREAGVSVERRIFSALAHIRTLAQNSILKDDAQ